MGKTAILIGATGLVGSHFLQVLLEDNRYDSVLVFHRRSTGISHPKLTEHIIDFDEPEKWKRLVTGDHLFSALGTTLKKPGLKKYHPIKAKSVAQAMVTGLNNNISGIIESREIHELNK